MQKVFKYELDICSIIQNQKIELPMGFKILAVQNQNNKITFWAKVDSANFTKPRRFSVVGTGWELGNMQGFEYVGTVQIGAFTWHVYME
jgi:hypothetical protein